MNANTGNVSAFKTMLVEAVLIRSPEVSVVTARLISIYLESDDVLRMVARPFGVANLDMPAKSSLRKVE